MATPRGTCATAACTTAGITECKCRGETRKRVRARVRARARARVRVRVRVRARARVRVRVRVRVRARVRVTSRNSPLCTLNAVTLSVPTFVVVSGGDATWPPAETTSPVEGMNAAP